MFFSNKKIIVYCSTTILFLLFNFVSAKTINLNSTVTYIENEIYYLDLKSEINLTKEAKKALLHGVSLEIHTIFQLYKNRTWLWNKKIKETMLIYRLEHQPLTEDYLVIDQKNGDRRTYKKLESALNDISSMSKAALFNTSILDSDIEYIARIKSYLDLDSLPSPMRPQAYFSPSWDISSDWHIWNIRQ